jgi:hypothetical protein
MKNIIAVAFVLLFVSPIFAQKRGTKYARFDYAFKMIKPVESDSMKFQDEVIMGTFAPHTKGVSFKIKNLTKEVIKIKWDEAVLTLEGATMKTIHNGVKLADKSSVQPPSVIPPGATIDDFVWPSDNVSLYTGGLSAGWKVEGMLIENNGGLTATQEKAFSMKGKVVGLYLPILRQEKQQDYFFEFEITDVTIRKK